jgi:hypothetical protein
MKKIALAFIITSGIKGLLLFLIILIGDYLINFPVLLRYLVYFLLIGLVDWKSLNYINKELGLLNYFKPMIFCYLTFIATLWIAGPLFQLYNSVNNIVITEEPEMPSAALIIYLIFGLFTSIISTITWSKKQNKTAANMV